MYRADYVELLCRLMKLLRPELSKADRKAISDKEWLGDSGGRGFIGKAVFSAAIVEVSQVCSILQTIQPWIYSSFVMQLFCKDNKDSQRFLDLVVVPCCEECNTSKSIPSSNAILANLTVRLIQCDYRHTRI